MSSTRDRRTSPIVADEEMTNPGFASEFMIESDEGSPLPHLQYDHGPDHLQTLDSIRTAEPKSLLSSPVDLRGPAPSANTLSPNTSHDSSSDSSSSKPAASLGSTFSTFTEYDAGMRDDDDAKGGFGFAAFMAGAADDELFGDGTIDPSRIEKHLSFQTSNSPEPAGVADTPNPFSHADVRPFPLRMSDIENGNSTDIRAPFYPHEARRRSQAYSHHSLSQTMNGLTTEGSRETTPLRGASSPSPMLDSPSPNVVWDSSKVPWDSQGAVSNWAHVFAKQAGLDAAPARIPTTMHAGPSAAGGFSVPHPYDSNLYRLGVHNAPAKSRVETQLGTKLTLFPAPPGITGLHLQAHTISRVKYLAKPPPQPRPNTLELHTTLVCTSAMNSPARLEEACSRARAVAQGLAVDEEKESQNGGEVRICSNCMNRERKRAGRKKIKKIEDEQLWLQNESRRVIVFNLHEIQEWQQSKDGGLELELPMRIACYCRHHGEKAGFRVIFTVTDCHANFVAQVMSESIMITDDHKTHAPPPHMAGGSVNDPDSSLMPVAPNSLQASSPLDPPGAAFHHSQSSSDLQMAKRSGLATFSPTGVPAGPSQPASTTAATTPRNLSRSASPTGTSGPPYSKKRKASGPAKVPSGLAMTRLDNPHPPLAQQPSRTVGASLSAATSPFSPNRSSFPPTAEGMFGCPPLNTSVSSQLYPVGSPTPNSNDQVMSGGMDSLFASQAQLYSAPPSSHPSRVPSPNGLRVNPSMLQQQQQQQQQLQNAQLSHALANTAQYAGAMNNMSRGYMIHKIIPAEGPKSGGVEVTILGSGFRQGSEVFFGPTRATTTTYWSENSLVCLLPPAAQAGLVLVTLEPRDVASSMQLQAKCPTFKYVDDDEQQLMRTALTVLGNKLNGNFEEVSDIARRIIGGNSPWTPSASNNGHSAGGSSYTKFEMSFEARLLKVLELIDLDDSTHKPRLNLRRSTGQTMLHLACSLGLHRFAAGLLARGANPDMHDVGGYTPLHVASLNNHPEIVRRLISYGADPTLRTLSGLTPADVAVSQDVVEAVRLVEKLARSYSSGSIHSRASSMASLKSLWGPASAAQPALGQTQTGESETSEEDPEYSSEDLSSLPDIDDGAWLNMRRRSMVSPLPHGDGSNTLLQPPQPDVPGGLGSPTAAVSVFKEHFTTQLQQFQQAMALQLQNLPQFSRPQMPHMPPLADYQAFLNSAAVFQRLTAMVPNIGVPRPGSANAPPGGRDVDGKWWDISSLMPSSAPPPAYEEIFPQGDLDKKQASAAQAAAEAEADHKCATLYDQPSSSAPPPEKISTSAQTVEQTTITSASHPEYRHHKLPELLQLGRKNYITDEQRENLRRAHAEKLKRLSRDRNLFFIWIPLLTITICAMLYSRFPGLFTIAEACIPSSNQGIVENAGQRVFEIPAGSPQRQDRSF